MIYDIYHTIDILLLILVSISGVYILIFSYASAISKELKFPLAHNQRKFIIIAFNPLDIEEQNYPSELYQVVVSNNLIETIQQIDVDQFDGVIVLGEATHVSPNLIKEVNDAFYGGAKAIQLHHITEGKLKGRSYWRAFSEEIRNAILKKGHNRLNFPSAFDSIDYAIELKWLKENLISSRANLENRLLHQGIYVYYLPYLHVYSAKARPNPKKYSKRKALSNLFTAMMEGNINYFDKMIRCFAPTWKTLLAIIASWCIISTLINWEDSIMWWFILAIYIFMLSVVTPDYLVEDKKKKKKIKK